MQLSGKLSAALGAGATPRRHRQLHTSHSQTEISRLNSNRSQRASQSARRPPKRPDHQGPSINLIKVHLLCSERLSNPNPAPRHTTNPPIPCPGDFRPPGVQRPILARLRRAAGRLYGRRRAMQFSSLLDNQCRGNVRLRPQQRLRAAAVSGGGCTCLWAFPPRRLSGDCTGRAASGAALPSAPGSACGAGALGRRANAYSGASNVGAGDAVHAERTAR